MTNSGLLPTEDNVLVSWIGTALYLPTTWVITCWLFLERWITKSQKSNRVVFYFESFDIHSRSQAACYVLRHLSREEAFGVAQYLLKYRQWSSIRPLWDGGDDLGVWCNVSHWFWYKNIGFQISQKWCELLWDRISAVFFSLSSEYPATAVESGLASVFQFCM